MAVDLPTKSVTRILHPDASMPAGTVPAPFAVAMPSDAANILVPASELVQRRERTRAFFAERGLPEFPGMTREMTPGGKTTSTADSTGEDSTTYCTEYGPQGQVYTSQKDDNRTDYWTDYNPDSVTDQNWDPTH